MYFGQALCAHALGIRLDNPGNEAMIETQRVLSETPAPVSADLLSDLLGSMHLSGAVLFSTESREPWGLYSLIGAMFAPRPERVAAEFVRYADPADASSWGTGRRADSSGRCSRCMGSTSLRLRSCHPR